MNALTQNLLNFILSLQALLEPNVLMANALVTTNLSSSSTSTQQCRSSPAHAPPRDVVLNRVARKAWRSALHRPGSLGNSDFLFGHSRSSRRSPRSQNSARDMGKEARGESRRFGAAFDHSIAGASGGIRHGTGHCFLLFIQVFQSSPGVFA